MTFTDTIRNDFADVLSDHGDTITINHVTSETVNEEGDTTPTYSSSSSTALVGRLDYEEKKLVEEGILHAGTLKLFIPYTDTVDVGDKITYNSKNWIVTSVTTTSNTSSTVFKIALIAPTR